MVLGDLVTLMSELEQKAYIKGSAGDSNSPVQTSGHSDVGSLWNPAASAALADIADWAGYLARTLVTQHPDRVVIAPDSDPRVVLATVARWYGRWFSGYPGLGGDLLAAAQDHRHEALRALQVSPVRRVGIRNAFCREHLEDTEYGATYCMGQLVATLRPEEDARPSQILCTLNPSHVQLPRDRWIEYAGLGV
ncbi:hypothetical protein [Marisediminicola sp. LYQ134]|uniref:hypothetical protein n=1 Tax=Marisediminicola sp. LYQ134 TaxID=3391061 RepID=UPI0039837601